ncbi:MAG: peptidoglycan-binding protein [Alphaproteobacteria bacterium]|nr:peptidoglycan-binding protein [Alphaproteobacteria bacterium]
MPTNLEKQTAQAIINIFETGRILGDYGMVTLLRNDTGQLTYGRSQTTLTSGNLYLLVKDYCEIPDADFGEQLHPYLTALKRHDAALNTDVAFRGLLKQAGDDPVMQSCQDAFFDRVYWTPAVLAANSTGVASPLGVAVVYDSVVHGSWRLMRDRTLQNYGNAGDKGEQGWVSNYVATRRAWLAGHSNDLLHKTVYRMDAFNQLIATDKWQLPFPLIVRGRTIDEAALLGGAAIRVSAQIAEERNLMLKTPFLQGSDVKALQDALVKAGAELEADGIFGPATQKAVAAFQQKRNLKSDGIAGPATRAALGL